MLGPSSAWFRIALASMSRASSSGVCGGSAVGEVAAKSRVSCSVDPASWAGRSEYPGSYSPDFFTCNLAQCQLGN